MAFSKGFSFRAFSNGFSFGAFSNGFSFGAFSSGFSFRIEGFANLDPKGKGFLVMISLYRSLKQ